MHVYTAADEWVGARIVYGTTLSAPFTFEAGGTYKWKIRASANQGPGEWSDFVTLTAGP